MKKAFLTVVLASMVFACAKPESGMLDDVSGIWRLEDDGTMVAINRTKDGVALVVGDHALPVKVGAIDEENDTINLNIDIPGGKPEIWTVRKVWNEKHDKFHLVLTLHDGTQDDMDFVRKVSPEDLADINKKTSELKAALSGGGSSVANKAEEVVAVNEESEAPIAEKSEDVCSGIDQSNSFGMSECGSKKYEIADGELNRVYKQLMSSLGQDKKVAIKKEQIQWIKEKESKCSEAGKEFEGGTMEPIMIQDCQVKMTEERLAYLKSYAESAM